MRSMHIGRAGLLAVVAAVASACSTDRAESPLSPTASTTGPRLEVVRPPVLAATLSRSTPLGETITVSAVIGPEGGEFKIKQAGLKVEVPAGAVSRPTTFTATAIAGDAYAYDFGPHGIRFAKPLEMEQQFNKKEREMLPRSARLEVAYFARTAQLDVADDEVVVNEFLPLTVDVKRNKLKWEVEHFSGYVISMGRKGTVSTTTSF